MKTLICSLATGSMMMMASSLLIAAPHNMTYSGGLQNDDGTAAASLYLNESNGQASLELTNYPYWPEESDYAFILPTLTLTGSYSYNSGEETISFSELKWDGDVTANNDSKLHVLQARCRTTSQGLDFIPSTNTLTGEVEMAGKFFYEGYGNQEESWDGDQYLTVDAPDPTPTPTPTPEPTPAPSSNSDYVFDNLNGYQWEQSVGYPALFDAPIFSEDALGLGLYVNDPTRTFGYWQTREQLDPLPAGRYSLKIYISADPSSISGRYPEMRIRVFQGDNSLSKMAIFAQTSTDIAVPPYVEVIWNSDGVSPWRVAIDILSFVPDYDGGYLVTAVTNDLM